MQPSIAQPQPPKEMSNDDKSHLAQVLAQVCALQKAYGKTAGELEILVEGFAFVLSDYSSKQITDAMRVFVRQSHEIPNPSEILAILDPKPEKLSSAVYVELNKKKRNGSFLTTQESDFLKAFELQEIKKANYEHVKYVHIPRNRIGEE